MGKPALLWPNERMTAFFRAVLGAEPGIDAATAGRLAARCLAHINRMLVIDDLPATAPAPVVAPVTVAPAETRETSRGDDGDDAAFDPYAFSAVVTLSRKGPEALLARLNGIDSAANLRRLAEAQHIGLDPGLQQPEELRLAILSGTRQRIADRKAAGS